jgi:ferric-dicitrate binding protein FerR (iron transport regulator)
MNHLFWRRRSFCGAAAISALFYAVTGRPTAAQSAVAGDVVALKLWAYGTAPDGAVRRDLFMSDPVYVRDMLETVADGALHVQLADQSVLRLGSATQIVVDEFVYKDSSESLEFLASISKGVCRFVTGKAKSKNFRVQTPTASIVARGTIFSVWVDASGETIVWVQEGEVEVTSAVDGAAATVGATEIVKAPAAGGIELDATRPPTDPGIADTSKFKSKTTKKGGQQ